MASSLLCLGRRARRQTAVVEGGPEAPVAVPDQGHDGHIQCLPSALIAARTRAADLVLVAADDQARKVPGHVSRGGERPLPGERAIVPYFFLVLGAIYHKTKLL